VTTLFKMTTAVAVWLRKTGRSKVNIVSLCLKE
jgi:hypothetical protein